MSTSPLPTYARSTVYELVAVPADLSAFAGYDKWTFVFVHSSYLCFFAADPQFQQILLKVKEQTAINFVSLNRISENCVESVAIDAPSKESASLARSLIETHFKLQTKVRFSISLSTNLEISNGLTFLSWKPLNLGFIRSKLIYSLRRAKSRQGWWWYENVLFRTFSCVFTRLNKLWIWYQEFTVSPDLVGVIIGKKGARIRQIEQDTGVSTINVNGETGAAVLVTGVLRTLLFSRSISVSVGKITIIGPDASSVQRAREHLELFEDSFELTPQHAQWLNDKYNSGVLSKYRSII